jgi:murein DD-endopeptidase MepM/ murein hydrolase activator NlpD
MSPEPAHSRPAFGRPAHWLAIGLLAAGLAACQAAPAATAVPVASLVAMRLTQTAAAASPTPPAPLPSATPAASLSPTASRTATPSRTPTDAATPTVTPTATETGTPAPPPRATVSLSSLPRPPASFGGDSHFYLGSPGAGFIASSYRYGSVGPGQRFSTHHGVDLAIPGGAPLVAMADGVIYYAGSDMERMFGPQTNFYGNLVVVQLLRGWNGRAVFALYGHMDEIYVQDGQVVSAGEALGTVGATGVALGPHAHVEVRLDAPDSYWATRNPELWLIPAGGGGALAIRVTNADGSYLPGVRVDFTCADGAARFVDTYWYSGVNPDDAYGENAAVTNIPAGFCRLEADILGQTVRTSTTVPAGGVGFAWVRP